MEATVKAKGCHGYGSYIHVWFTTSSDLAFVHPTHGGCYGMRTNDVGVPFFDY